MTKISSAIPVSKSKGNEEKEQEKEKENKGSLSPLPPAPKEEKGDQKENEEVKDEKHDQKEEVSVKQEEATALSASTESLDKGEPKRWNLLLDLLSHVYIIVTILFIVLTTPSC